MCMHTAQVMGVSAEATEAMNDRWRQSRLEEIANKIAMRKLTRAVLSVPGGARARRIAASLDPKLAAIQEAAVQARHEAVRTRRHPNPTLTLAQALAQALALDLTLTLPLTSP